MPRYGIPLDVEAALPQFLSAWGIEPIEIDEIEEGYENQNLLVVAPAGRFAIRRYSFRNPAAGCGQQARPPIENLGVGDVLSGGPPLKPDPDLERLLDAALAK